MLNLVNIVKFEGTELHKMNKFKKMSLNKMFTNKK